MSDLDRIKGLIARGDKENAVAQLASILMENKDELEAWLLLGEIIDDPSRKKDCYNWALRLSPHNVVALTKLQELEPTPGGGQVASSKDAQTGTRDAVNKLRRNSKFVPFQNAYPTVSDSKEDPEVVSYFIVGIVAVAAILYVIVTGNSSGYSNIFCTGLLFLSLSTIMMILFVINKNRS